MKTLIIAAHPHIAQSVVNKRWLDELAKHPDRFTVHRLYTAYPDGKIDIAREQALVEAHGGIVFQFPVYWFNCPPLLKQWFDDVLTYGWAYGSTGRKLVGKNFGLAVSIGDKETNYTRTGDIGFSVDEVLTPFKATVGHVGADLLPYFALFGASFQATDEEIAESAKAYAARILQWQSM